MNNSRAARRLGDGLALDTEKASGIKLYDAAKAREMLARQSSQDTGSKLIESPDKSGAAVSKNSRSQFSRKAMNLVKNSVVS